MPRYHIGLDTITDKKELRPLKHVVKLYTTRQALLSLRIYHYNI